MDVLKNLGENPTIATHIRIWTNSAIFRKMLRNHAPLGQLF